MNDRQTAHRGRLVMVWLGAAIWLAILQILATAWHRTSGDASDDALSVPSLTSWSHPHASPEAARATPLVAHALAVRVADPSAHAPPGRGPAAPGRAFDAAFSSPLSTRTASERSHRVAAQGDVRPYFGTAPPQGA